jgi:putative transcriptional regulator
MDLFNNIQKHGDKPEAGKVLISEPFLFDSNFKRSVILLCEHNDENGSLGFILNKQLKISLKDVMDVDTPLTIPLFLGGPVQNNTLHYIHSDITQAGESVDLGNGIYWGGNFEELIPKLELGILEVEKYKFFLGYSGWGKGQLQDELDINSWIVSNASRDIIFGDLKNGMLWKSTLQNMGGSYRLLSNSPENPFLN